jgi:hypothetical protein
MMKESIDWPTEGHKALSEHILNVCMANQIGVLLIFSQLNGIAHDFAG